MQIVSTYILVVMLKQHAEHSKRLVLQLAVHAGFTKFAGLNIGFEEPEDHSCSGLGDPVLQPSFRA